jgi:hypothetical protein
LAEVSIVMQQNEFVTFSDISAVSR